MLKYLDNSYADEMDRLQLSCHVDNLDKLDDREKKTMPVLSLYEVLNSCIDYTCATE